MFNRFSRRNKKGRGTSEDPAAPFLVSRSTQSTAREMVDYALIDETVNEWMTDASKAKQASAASPTPQVPVPESPIRPNRPSPGVIRQTSIQQGIGRVAVHKPLENRPLPHPVLHRADQTPLNKEDMSRLDRVLQRAYAAHLVAPETLRPLLTAQKAATIDWRSVASHAPDHAHALGRLAADTYGFRSILICQMGTLVLADLMTMRVPPHMWRSMFEAGVVPVVEHGSSPDPNERILCASSDPSSRKSREFLQGIKSFRPESVYSDDGHIRAVMELIAQHVPAIGAEVRVVRPDVVRVHPGAPPSGSHTSHRAA